MVLRCEGQYTGGDNQYLEHLAVSQMTNFLTLVSTRLNVDAVWWRESNDMQAATRCLLWTSNSVYGIHMLSLYVLRKWYRWNLTVLSDTLTVLQVFHELNYCAL